MNRIVIEIKSGCVNDIYADDPSVEVFVVDYDVGNTPEQQAVEKMDCLDNDILEQLNEN